MLLDRVARTSLDIAGSASRKKKVALLAALLRHVPADERAPVARYLAGELGYKTGIGYATVGELRGSIPPAATPTLAITDVDRRFAAIAELSGTGSNLARKQTLGELFALATEVEQGFLSAVVVGELRQGALDALVVDAIAMACELSPKTVRTAYMLAGEIGVVAAAVLADATAVHTFGLTLFRPILPMLAQTADDATAALAEFPETPMSFELKLDGFRLQLHKDGDLVRAYSRALNDVTKEVGPLLDIVRELPARRLILDAEAIAYRADGRPLPFQDTMKLKAGGQSLTLSAFDLLLVDDDTLLTKPARDRFTALAAAAPVIAVPH
ncbi:MAG: ATP-dependent DNA ligase, partial [Deltaproteobacteria bacterium]|nr:ATP-dependent DNA ligase [Deltaproteobacteria bacterium]